ncbi:hypothetical protein T492DRAFT_1067909 [Pavlovales sp. CCMP2436]|nr:hypothetical protein T492DRAFT_1067909 [Pavlovales sp. CCMP2436]
MVQQVLFSHWIGRPLTPKGVSVCAPAPTPRLGRASAAAALPWRSPRAASSS